MSKNIIFKKPRKLKKQAEEIIIHGEEITTRMLKSTVRKRINDWRTYGYAEMLGNYDYSEFINWGAEGGRPRTYTNEAEKKRAYRLRLKLKAHGKGQISKL